MLKDIMVIKMNWENILKEKDDKVNDMLHDFFIKMHDRVNELQLAKFSSPRMINDLEEIEGLTEKLRDKLEEVLEPYFEMRGE